MNRRLLLYVTSFPGDAFCALMICVVMRLLWGRRTVFRRGCLWMELREDAWFTRTYYRGWGATTFGHVILVAAHHLDWADRDPVDLEPLRSERWEAMDTTDPLRDLAIQVQLADHELVHVEAYEAFSLFTAGLAGTFVLTGWAPWWAGLGLAVAGGVLSFVLANATAWLRGEDPYLGSFLEEAARMRVTCRANPELSKAARLGEDPRG